LKSYRIIIYESSSFGGCYKYALELYKAYSESPEVNNVQMLLPENAIFDDTGVHKILLPDNLHGNKFRFLKRHFINPFILFSFLWKQASAFVLLNDFEQLSAPFWGPLYRLFLRKHVFGVFLHDADRDAYPPDKWISAYCMRQIMKTVKIALHHGLLPAKSYYPQKSGLSYLKVNHGIYSLPDPDMELLDNLKEKTGLFSYVLSIPGNIRPEKNYSLAISALQDLPDYCLIIAGSRANSNVETRSLKDLIIQKGVEKQVIWIEKYLSEQELAAVIHVSDLVVLYYAAGFHAQSGILHQVIPFKKAVLVSDLPNALTETVRHYGLGYICKPDDIDSLKDGLSQLQKNPGNPDWEGCMEDMDWRGQVDQVILTLTKSIL
jgi:glycosyltransferase involved in cell wall biosynthesis